MFAYTSDNREFMSHMKKLSLSILGTFIAFSSYSQTLKSVTEAPDANYTPRNIWVGMEPGGGAKEQALNVGGKVKLLGASQSYTIDIDANQPTIYRSGVPTAGYPFNNYDNLILQAGIQDRDILFVTGLNPAARMVIKGNGSVGIGTSTPATMLDIATKTDVYGLNIGDNNNSSLKIAGTASGVNGYGLLQTFVNATTPGGSLVFQREGGKVGIGIGNPQFALHTVSFNNTGVVSALLWGQYYGAAVATASTSASHYAFQVMANVTSTGVPGAGGNKSLFYVRADGNVGIGTTDPGSFKLAVEGTLGARRVKVTQQPIWADFVFHEHYQLPSLQLLEEYIKQHRHLPDIPTESEVRENGIDIGDMNAKLLQKIEELTLYIIELNKKNQVLEQRMSEMEQHTKCR